ncbi:MAG: hypothetical protein H6601_06250 [Flavobacteriales bacterium]|nr:hypothetical protein [Flavobacteriales bacterium]
MQTQRGLIPYLTGFLVATIFLSMFCITLSGFQLNENAWLSVIVNSMNEEETEDIQIEDSEVNDAEWTVPVQFNFSWDKLSGTGEYSDTSPHIQYVMEVVSPPPEA